MDCDLPGRAELTTDRLTMSEGHAAVCDSWGETEVSAGWPGRKFAEHGATPDRAGRE